jgi:Uma2 family endonuclease
MSSAFEEQDGDEAGIQTVASYEEYLAIEDRCEVIEGLVYMMSAPLLTHQLIAGGVYTQLANQLEDKPCTPFISPVDVRLFPDENPRKPTVVEPDVIIVCDPDKIDNEGGFIRGAPDFVLEVLSPSTRSKDMVKKFSLYAKAGVKEYWIIDPEYKNTDLEGRMLIQAVLQKNNGRLEYITENVIAQGIIALKTFNLSIDFDRAFAKIPNN